MTVDNKKSNISIWEDNLNMIPTWANELKLFAVDKLDYKKEHTVYCGYFPDKKLTRIIKMLYFRQTESSKRYCKKILKILIFLL